MARSNEVGAQLNGVIQKRGEFDFRVAQHVRVWRPARIVFMQKRGKNAIAIFLGKVHDLDIDTENIGHAHDVDQILTGAAIFVRIVVLPVLHEQADDAIALLFEQ